MNFTKSKQKCTLTGHICKILEILSERKMILKVSVGCYNEKLLVKTDLSVICCMYPAFRGVASYNSLRYAIPLNLIASPSGSLKT